MSTDEDHADKSFDPTPEKLLKARRKGDISKSTDLMTAASYGGLFIALTFAGQMAFETSASALAVLLDQPVELADTLFQGSAKATSYVVAQSVLAPLLPVFIVPGLCVLLSIFAQRALVFAPQKIAFKASRLSLLANAKNKFGPAGLFEFAKSFSKLCIYSVCLSIFIRTRLDEIISVVQMEARTAISLMIELCLGFIVIAVCVSVVIGGVDALWQHFDHLRKNRMSRKELQDEQKDSDGDPHLKQERRRRAIIASQNHMMADVPTADVIIVNPTHYAIALKWSRLPGEAPVCIAKGVDELARAIRDAGIQAKVPIHSDAPTARAIFATTDIGDMIAPEHFFAVAAAIRFAEKMRKKARAGA